MIKNVLSLFDGMSCGQIALNKVGIEYENYFASEIDKYAIQVTKNNYPNTTQLGSVTDVNANSVPQIDLLIGGSPCQSFSNLGNGKGFDGKSSLFWQYVRVLNEIKPKYFLLENVVMKKEWEDIITEALGVKPVMINSNVFSAQNRKRLYWTNIDFKTIVDNDIQLKDILYDQVCEKYYLSDKAIKYITDKTRLNKKLTSINGEKASCLLSQYSQSLNGTFLCVDCNGRIDNLKTGTLPSRYYKGTETQGSSPFIFDGRFRKLTPNECEKLQTVPLNYTDCVSDSQRYKMLGNGWTVDVIAHIFKGLK